MAEYQKTITISKDELETINEYLNWEEGDDEDYHLSEDETIIHTAIFDNGMVMDIKCCGSQDEAAWTEAVLFYPENGALYEVGCSDVEDTFDDEWELEYEDDKYVVNVVVEEES